MVSEEEVGLVMSCGLCWSGERLLVMPLMKWEGCGPAKLHKKQM